MVGAGQFPNILITKWEDDTLCVVCMWRVESTTTMENSKLHPGIIHSIYHFQFQFQPSSSSSCSYFSFSWNTRVFVRVLVCGCSIRNSIVHHCIHHFYLIQATTAVSRIFQAIISLPIMLTLQLQANEYYRIHLPHIYTFQLQSNLTALFFNNKSGRLKHFAPCLQLHI